jgi:predicted DCC family thiol-disulfide oxidoreductase YuxK
MTEKKAVVLFDGHCNLCNGSVQFIILRDKKGYFNFCSLQSEAGQALLEKHQLSKTELNSLVLIENEKAYRQSTAALRIAKKLDGAWPLFYGFIIVPPFIRNFFYNLIAKNRYKLFGKKDECMLPRPEWRERFL